MAPATSAVPLLAAILAAVLVSSAAAAGPAPNLPHQYSVDRNKTECGGGQGGTCGAYSSRFHFDWDSRASLEVMDLSPTTYKVRVWTPGWVWNWDLTPLSSLLTPPPPKASIGEAPPSRAPRLPVDWGRPRLHHDRGEQAKSVPWGMGFCSPEHNQVQRSREVPATSSQANPTSTTKRVCLGRQGR